MAAVLDRAPALGAGEWWLTKDPRAPRPSQARAGSLDGGRGTGIRDVDLSHWDDDPSWDAVIRRGADPALLQGPAASSRAVGAGGPFCWCSGRFGTAAPPAFRDCAQAIDAFAAVCCAVGVTVDDGGPRLYAPHGLDDLLGLVVRPNPASPAPRDVYETKAARWQEVWPGLTVLPWAPGNPGGSAPLEE